MRPDWEEPMAVSGLLALLDDVTSVLDDVAAMSKVAAEKTAGIAGDDLAVNAEGLVGLEPARELPIVGKVAMGSVVNKFVLVPLALVLPKPVITPLLMFGGTFLCYEGVHKVLHKKGHADEVHHDALAKAVQTGPEALAAVESEKVKQAILTDVILSAEIVAVALGAVADAPFATKALVLSVVSLGMTVAIYGLVAALVKLDDIGLHLKRTGAPGSATQRLGEALIAYTPLLMRGISVVGTVAMFLVGGGIVLHGFHLEAPIHHAIEGLVHAPLVVSGISTVLTLAAGVIVGGTAAIVVDGILKRILGQLRPGATGSR